MTDFIYGFVGFIFGLYFFLRLFSEIVFWYDPSANRIVQESTLFNKTFHEQKKVPHIIHQIWVVHHHPRHLDEDDAELGSPGEYALAFKYEHIRSITADGDDDEDDDELGSP